MHVLAYSFSELGLVSVRWKVTSRVWPPSRAGPGDATCFGRTEEGRRGKSAQAFSPLGSSSSFSTAEWTEI